LALADTYGSRGFKFAASINLTAVSFGIILAFAEAFIPQLMQPLPPDLIEFQLGLTTVPHRKHSHFQGE
jgi:hypothetical protein